MSKAEVSDYTSADAYLKGGRGGHGRRPLKDGWNTVLVRTGSSSIDIALKNTTVVRYEPTVTSAFMPKTRDFVAIDRIQRYALGDAYLLDATNDLPEYYLYAKGQPLAHGVNEPQFAYEWKGFVPKAALLTLDLATGSLSPWVAGSAPPSTARKQFWHGRVQKYATGYVKAMLEGKVHVADSQMCFACRESPGTKKVSLARQLRDAEHLFAHVMEGVFPPLLIVDVLASRGLSLDEIGTDGSDLGTAIRDPRRIAKHLSSYLLNEMRVY